MKKFLMNEVFHPVFHYSIIPVFHLTPGVFCYNDSHPLDPFHFIDALLVGMRRSAGPASPD